MNRTPEWISTRQSLLSRLRNWQDGASWEDFFGVYWKLIYNAAVKAGLTDAEAQDVVQETVISVCKQMPGATYDRSLGPFKAWLLQLTHWRIVDQLRRRPPYWGQPHSRSDETATVDRVPDPASLAELWEADWEQNLVDAAIERVKTRADTKQYQLFDLYVLKQWPIAKIKATLGVRAADVYFAKFYVAKRIQKEVRFLQTRFY
ncbi:MAG: sigma-70 family RNA polymerase sigma factor [Verrucomicrobia bacterium]|nr:sigma-70 family RNA polymerase sigma factor [Verrucomicrobiota bacterium]